MHGYADPHFIEAPFMGFYCSPFSCQYFPSPENIVCFFTSTAYTHMHSRLILSRKNDQSAPKLAGYIQFQCFKQIFFHGVLLSMSCCDFMLI